jgi:hypothetical protein
MSLTFYTGHRIQGTIGQTIYFNVLVWRPDGESNVLKITGPRRNTPADVLNSEGPESQGYLWENNLDMIDETSRIFVCTVFGPDMNEVTHGSASVSDFGHEYDSRGIDMGGYFVISSNNDWSYGTILRFMIVNGSAPKGCKIPCS